MYRLQNEFACMTEQMKHVYDVYQMNSTQTVLIQYKYPKYPKSVLKLSRIYGTTFNHDYNYSIKNVIE